MDASTLIAAVAEAELVREQSVYGGLFLVFVTCGLLSLLAFGAAPSQPLYIRPFVLAAGTMSALLQLGFLAVSVTREEIGLSAWEGLLLPLHALVARSSWSGIGPIAFHVLPSLGIIATLLAIPWSWRSYALDLAEADRLAAQESTSQSDVA